MATGQTPSPRPALRDVFDRTISYLRLSLTDRCNLKCLYCASGEDLEDSCRLLPQQDLLTYEELLRVVRIAVAMGISKVRLTGGEPLVRRGVMGFIRELSRIPDLRDVRLTTNGVLLARYAAELYAAGVRKVNVSLDTMRPQRFREITGADRFEDVWRGIEAVLAYGFAPVKLNMVVMRGVNDDEIEDFARLSQERPLQVRFIEFMPLGDSSRWSKETFMSSDEIRARIERLGPLVPQRRGAADGPARVFRLGGDTPGSLGFISPISHHFCDRCNRLRLTSEGRLRSCLLHDREYDLKGLLRAGGGDDEIRALLLEAIRNKPRGHQLAERLEERGGHCHGRMFRIGG